MEQPTWLRFNQAELGKYKPAAPSGEPRMWGPVQGLQDRATRGPGFI